MKIIILLLTIIIFSCTSIKKTSHAKLPSAVSKTIHFDMSREDFEKMRNQETTILTDSNDFRYMYIENLESNNAKNIVYYFDKDGKQPLYEVIIIYNTTEERDVVAKKIFGEPNHENKEWRITRKKSYNVWAWTFKSKLIIVGMIPDTEWSDKNW